MRLGLVAAASQRQGKRPTQEDRVRMAPDLALALMGKVSAVDPRPYLLIFFKNPHQTFWCYSYTYILLLHSCRRMLG